MKWSVAIGTLFGGLLASWLGPKAIVWYATPSVDIGVTCELAVANALSNLQVTQSVGMALGCVGGLVLHYVFRKNKSEPGVSVE